MLFVYALLRHTWHFLSRLDLQRFFRLYRFDDKISHRRSFEPPNLGAGNSAEWGRSNVSPYNRRERPAQVVCSVKGTRRTSCRGMASNK